MATLLSRVILRLSTIPCEHSHDVPKLVDATYCSHPRCDAPDLEVHKLEAHKLAGTLTRWNACLLFSRIMTCTRNSTNSCYKNLIPQTYPHFENLWPVDLII